MQVGGRLIYAVVIVVLMNRERKEEYWTVTSWMGKSHQARPMLCQDLRYFTDFGTRLLIHQVAKSQSTAWCFFS